MVVDASALVAILTGEEDRNELLRRLEAVPSAAVSAVVIYEATHAVARKGNLDLRQAFDLVETFVRQADLEVVSITREAGRAAIDASARYGKGSGHPARLNMGDCFSYALAKSAGVPLLYKGDDFARTDLA